MLGGFIVHGQFVANEYEVQVAHVFPGAVTGDGFENVDTITFQNVGEYALFDAFNQINSAYLADDTQTEIRRNRFDHKVESGDIEAAGPDVGNDDLTPEAATGSNATGAAARPPDPADQGAGMSTSAATGSINQTPQPAVDAATATDTERAATGTSDGADTPVDVGTAAVGAAAASPTDPVPNQPAPEPAATSGTTSVSLSGRVQFALLAAATTSSLSADTATSPESGTSGTNLSTPPVAKATSSSGGLSDDAGGASGAPAEVDQSALPVPESGTTTQAGGAVSPD